MENEAFWSPKPKKAPKTIEKALPREGFRIAFPRSEKRLIQPMENQLFQKSSNAFRKPYENLGQMKEIWSKNAKGRPKTLENH